MQQWLNVDPTDQHHFNQSLLLQVPVDFTAEQLNPLMNALCQRHDALRLIFSKQDNQWLANYTTVTPMMIDDAISYQDLRGLSHSDYQTRLAEIGQQAQSSFILGEGVLFKAVYLEADGNDSRVLLVMHHMIVDGVSWRVLLQDLTLGYQQLVAGNAVKLAAKTNSLQQWGEFLVDYAQTEQLVAERADWLAQLNIEVPALLVDHQVEDNRHSTTQKITVKLDQSHTQALLTGCHQAYHTEINDLLLSALFIAMSRWTGQDKVRVDLEGHGREALSNKLDLSQTIGWFTSVYPVTLNVTEPDSITQVIKAAKEQLRNVPNHGIGFGLLHDLAADEDLKAARLAAPSSIVFNYLGQFDHHADSDTLFTMAEGFAGDAISKNRQREYVIGFNGMVTSANLAFEMDYNGLSFDCETMQTLADAFETALKDIINHCQNASVSSFTPSDFPLATVSQSQLDQWQQQYPKFENLYASTPMQQGMLFHSALEQSSYLTQLSMDLGQDLNVDAFKSAWQKMQQQYPVLRTVFVGKQMDQLVLSASVLPWFEDDWSTGSGSFESKFDEYCQADKLKGFDIEFGPLMRFALIRQSNDKFRFLWTSHHALLDGWSVANLFAEVFQTYHSLNTGEQIQSRAVPAYANYIKWLQQKDSGVAENYWQETLKDVEVTTRLGVEKPVVGENTTAAPVMRLLLEASQTEQLQQLARRSNSTLNTVIQGAWAYLLHRYSGEEQVVFGETVAGRPEELNGVEQMVGLFLNTLPVCVDFSQDQPLESWLQDLYQSSITRKEHGYLSLPAIQATSPLGHDVALFDSLVVFENYPIDEAIKNPQSVFDLDSLKNDEQSNFALTLQVMPGERLELLLKYNAEQFTDVTITRILSAMQEILVGFANDITDVKQLSLVSSSDKAQQQQLMQMHGEYPKASTIVELFEQQVEQHADNVAMLSDDENINYATLNQQANQLANYLIEQGVIQGSFVGLCMHRGADMIVAMLAILKAGAAYVPIDPDYPGERVDYMLKDADLKVVLTHSECMSVFSSHSIAPIAVDVLFQAGTLEQLGVDNLTIIPTDPAKQLAYVIYTSGSTGKPKGVVVNQLNVVRLVKNTRYVELNEKDVIAQASNCSFDAATFEIWGALLNGAQLQFVSKEVLLDAKLLSETLVDKKITTLFLTTALFNQMSLINPAGFSTLKNVLFGGELVDNDAVSRIFTAGKPTNLLHVYGPTENTTFSTSYNIKELSQNTDYPIGQAIDGGFAMVMDPLQNLLPIGIVGELVLGGDGIAMGYLNQSKLNADTFIEHAQYPGQKLYRTGDLVRLREDGELVFVGRVDDQVKIRGFRIEPGEIVRTLNLNEGVDESFILVSGSGSDKQLIAYLVPSASVTANAEFINEVCQWLKGRLPEYMQPATFIALDKLPLSQTGKVDRKALPAPDMSQWMQTEFVAPVTDTEQKLCAVWARLLKLEKVSTNASFFELGGHSLLVTHLTSAVNSAFSVSLSLRQVFDNNTVGELAKVIENSHATVVVKLPVVSREQELPASFTQQRFWFIDQLEGGSHYNLQSIFQLSGQFDHTCFERALSALVERHEVLRTTFTDRGGQAYQLIQSAVSIILEQASVVDLPVNEKVTEIEKLAREQVLKPFDLTCELMLRANVVVQGQDDHVLILTVPHIAFDGVSLSIFTRELSELYTAFVNNKANPLPPLTVQYADFACWQRNWFQGRYSLSSLITGVSNLPSCRWCTACPLIKNAHQSRLLLAQNTAVA
ncbi:amino acid adenylation domain-containing protein [Pseudoalteromonas sp. B62]|uniref:amino acid adenylation domain-containing protein n=1 Tax=Pseudoalteromonas sp. B62 TaxID=630483 RepID=UPI00301D3953